MKNRGGSTAKAS